MSRIGPAPDHIIETEVGGDISLYDPSRAEVLVLNTTASDIWRLSDGKHTLDNIISLLAQAYGKDPASIRPDVEATVRDMIERGFLPPADPA